jgi:hypothetical protein
LHLLRNIEAALSCFLHLLSRFLRNNEADLFWLRHHIHP